MAPVGVRFLQDEINNTAKRADRSKILPHGVPNDMYEHPHDYGVLGFKVIDLFTYMFILLSANKQIKLRQDAIDTVRNLYAPGDHEVFQLVPPDFLVIISQIYVELGQPPVTRQSCWDIYLALLDRFHALNDTYNIPADIDAKWGHPLTMACDDYAKDIDLLLNLRPLRTGDAVIGLGGFYYMGSVNNGGGLRKSWDLGSSTLFLMHKSGPDSQQSAQLDQMLNEDEPQVGEDDNDTGVFAWFSDEGHGGEDDLDEW
ncbi:hypothetical protein C8R45DRAFT_1097301 [Mycena sanguinolenta]|nr:hypothetical protein C8R45DRAFT_1097301 [Mycena sanguinolenta]